METAAAVGRELELGFSRESRGEGQVRGGEEDGQGTGTSCPPGSRSGMGRAAWEDRPRHGANEEERERS